MLFAILFVTNLFSNYENARQALINTSLPQLQSSAKVLATTARAEKQPAIAAKADAVAASKDIASARAAFAALSDEMIKFRAAAAGDRPAVAYCSMEKKSWLQPKGEITNPYVASSMRACGEFREK